jgi:proteasome lid subunit RPN8/RPN11
MDPLSRPPASPWPRGLWLARPHWEQMAAEVERHVPEETCGLVAGRAGRSVAVYPVENLLHSPVRFRMVPEQQVKCYFEILEKGWDLVAIYHSHPEGPPDPSPTDIAEAAYPEAVSLIWSRQGQAWSCRGFHIWNGQVRKVKVRLFS